MKLKLTATGLIHACCLIQGGAGWSNREDQVRFPRSARGFRAGDCGTQEGRSSEGAFTEKFERN